MDLEENQVLMTKKLDRIWPHVFNGVELIVQAKDAKHYDVIQTVEEIEKKEFETDRSSADHKFEHLVIFDMPKVGKHSLYVESYDVTTKYVNTINSWGLKKNPNPKIAIEKIERFYRISCQASVRKSPTTTSQQPLYSPVHPTPTSLFHQPPISYNRKTSSNQNQNASTASSSVHVYTPTSISTQSSKKKFYKSNIPNNVIKNVVYQSENGVDLIVENGQIRHGNTRRYFTQKECHSFIKEVVSNNKVHVFQSLLNNGMQLNMGDLIYLACQHGCLDMAAEIMHNDVDRDANRVTKYGWTAVEISAINGHIDIVKMLVYQYNANVNHENPHNLTTPLENAIDGGHFETVKVMIEELNARYGRMANSERYVDSPASQEELINPGNEYEMILRYLQRYHTEKGQLMPVTIQSRLERRLRNLQQP